MSNNTLSNENIFSIPIDQFEENFNNIPNNMEIIDNNEFIHKENKIKIDTSIPDYKSNKPGLDKSKKNIKEKYFGIINTIKKNEDTMNGCKYIPTTIVYSKIKDDRQIKSLTNSSKLYVCEFLNYNWKNKSKRFVVNNKIKYIELIKEMEK